MAENGKDFLVHGLGETIHGVKESLALKKLNDAKALKNKDQGSVNQAATDFEALLLQQMFESMWASVETKDGIFASKEEELYRDMFHDALAKEVAKGKGIGIKHVIMEELQGDKNKIK